jgi:hypothetical protein
VSWPNLRGWARQSDSSTPAARRDHGIADEKIEAVMSWETSELFFLAERASWPTPCPPRGRLTPRVRRPSQHLELAVLELTYTPAGTTCTQSLAKAPCLN